MKYRTIDKAIKAAGKKLPILRDKPLNQNLEMFCGDFAEAYRVGAHEAQEEIISRLRELAAKENQVAVGKRESNDG